MRLNTLQPAVGSRKARKRVGRGIGTGLGKTCGRGHKGQNSRSGGCHKIGFEGGQMPLQRRLPKVGFTSRKAKLRAEVTLSEVAKIETDVVDMKALYKAGILSRNKKYAKVILSGAIDKAVTLKGIGTTKGAQAAIENAGGRVDLDR